MTSQENTHPTPGGGPLTPGGGPPTNWQSAFGGPAWKRDPVTGLYFYRPYAEGQPALNWRNPAVQKAISEIIRWWCDRRVDGWRMDVISRWVVDAEFRDNPPNPQWTPDQLPHKQLLATYTAHQPEVFEIIARIRDVLDDYGAVMIGEMTDSPPPEILRKYYDAGALPMGFALMRADWKAEAIANTINNHERVLTDVPPV